MIDGDFNNVVNLNERLGSAVTLQEVEGFRSCLRECEIQEMEIVGPFFTWSNKQEGDPLVYSKIDRVFVNMYGGEILFMLWQIFYLRVC